MDFPEHLSPRQTHGFLRNKKADEILQLINEFSEVAPEEVPEDSRFLLEINFSEINEISSRKPNLLDTGNGCGH